jgi:hypothetical protein
MCKQKLMGIRTDTTTNLLNINWHSHMENNLITVCKIQNLHLSWVNPTSGIYSVEKNVYTKMFNSHIVFKIGTLQTIHMTICIKLDKCILIKFMCYKQQQTRPVKQTRSLYINDPISNEWKKSYRTVKNLSHLLHTFSAEVK